MGTNYDPENYYPFAACGLNFTTDPNFMDYL